LYFARARYDYKFSKWFFVFSGVDWLRNKFAGIDSRQLFAMGAGNTWTDAEKMRFKTDYGVTYTFESEVVENPFIKSDFPGARFGYDFWWKFTTTTEFSSLFVADWNLDNTDDIRIDCKNELPVSVSDKLKLKPGLQLLWRNAPALTAVDLFNSGGTPAGTQVLVPLKELDTIFTLSLVFEM
jgi:putative salt-induced outer membrane protein YdiY